MINGKDLFWNPFFPLFLWLQDYLNNKMRKSLVFTIISLLFLNIAHSQDEGIIINIPEKVKAGNEFLLIVSFPKNHMTGVSRLRLQLPNGFTAMAKKTENADFKFEDQKASFQWLSFPTDQVVEVSMGVSVVSTIEGYFVLRGVANWIQNNEPVKTDLYPQIITVLPGDKSEEELNNSFEKTKFSFEEFNSEGVACIRQVPYENNGEVIVNLLVSKGDLNKYGKIQETIPPGYRVENIKSQNAIFVFNDKQHVVKYMWMSMPEKPKFVVSYKLIPTENVDKLSPFLIYGTFYYADNNKTLTTDIQERGIELTEGKE
ncbi:MAG TPA: hypothetical protein DCQ26_15535 [Marinilabiliales bacterium]|jgi:hypothetical protein|nr:MAG: hypothetical protein A2W95_14530 [Bacteroidetes bacterium GWA2_40_14]OFX60880.1 MAG: hypothetical protein A2W84_17565 [Bacteroidetes bacterium GWC2_40_13]OFX71534.1 MAG: hypothetical protein A2W96_10315 [Bacteroidetes bacterium GWD2_40_43]OFX95568.1 MAG: hypothetical protein A2W97_00635 [Bacteroidetes bacterium GWE2_40_63]OFY22274.1 MAG: hypothetical protein A2W88_07090 [Bacteroidetes bacterium GWF2_40_13]OFZ24910.1 MAG: hypothetical protein A2437_14725 [Bacteroidetes bacterium RIFOXYC